MPITSVSSSTWRSSSAELPIFTDWMRISLCETISSSRKPIVEDRLENLHLLAGDLRAAQPADQLFALAAEHAAGDDFDPAVGGGAVGYIHEMAQGSGLGDRQALKALRPFIHSRLILAGFRADADPVAFVDERRHRSRRARFRCAPASPARWRSRP